MIARRRTSAAARLACLGLLAAVACGQPGPGPAATPLPGSPSAPTRTPGAGPSPTRGPTPTLIPTLTPTPAPLELVVCQTDEPSSLYLYAADTAARDGIFAALFDGPIDSLGYRYQPVILEALPSVEAGTAGVSEVTVSPGDHVVDALTGAVVPLVEGVALRQPDGTTLSYAGSEPARTVQVWAQFTLRAGVAWSDGQPVQAADSVFSFQVAASADTASSKYVTSRTASYEVVDARSTRWVGMPGWLDTDYAQRFWTPLPHHVYGTMAPAELAARPEANEAALGWGPFKLAPGGWVKGSHLTLERNANYFRAGEGLPLLDRVTFRFGLSAEAIVAEVAAGTCAIGAASVDYGPQLEAVRAAEAAGQLTLQFVPASVYEHLDFGMEPAPGYKRAAGNDLFQDARLRHAVAFCLDRQALVDQFTGGLSEVPAVYVPASHPDFGADQLVGYPFDPGQGQALLADAGWLDADGDGVREQGRRRLSVQLASGPPESAFRTALLEAISGQLLANCGIEAVPALVSAAELYDPWPTGVLFGRRFDLASFPWRTGAEPPCDLYVTGAIPGDQNPGGANNTGYSNPAFDEACLRAQTALDEATRHAGYAAAQAVFTQDLPSLPLFFRMTMGLASPQVRGYKLDPTAASDLWNIEAIGVE